MRQLDTFLVQVISTNNSTLMIKRGEGCLLDARLSNPLIPILNCNRAFLRFGIVRGFQLRVIALSVLSFLFVPNTGKVFHIALDWGVVCDCLVVESIRKFNFRL